MSFIFSEHLKSNRHTTIKIDGIDYTIEYDRKGAKSPEDPGQDRLNYIDM